MAALTSLTFPHEDVCLDADVKILFRIGEHRTLIASEILSIISQGPPPDDGTESSFIFFWDFNIRRVLELLIPDGKSIRESNENTSTGICDQITMTAM